ncbi:MAG TPA: single-stranded DNA-binding protein [Niabella sp.]|nr:single-stranded DNA-binding protein [Niabella sp.]HOZ97608.1 single-stranded DNA-binding protein [Niabella sp.]HQW15746.1 single-stranded DNA-binding protein [Niabella sp.]HQX21021.1 single-stranded DNA-binding protein [Niabella sp.]HQX41882.1 single-stranded DNA-binding protein [Niabella sp.]
MIKMHVIGNLGKDCVVNNVNGKGVINFTIAHTEKFKDSHGNSQERTTWVDCAWWTDRTNVSQYLLKGKQVYVEGTPEVRSFTRNDGTFGATLTMRVRELQMLGTKNEGSQTTTQSGYGSNTGSVPSAQSSAPAQANPLPAANSSTNEPIDDLPF